MNKYEELRSMCSSSKILCGTDVYNLLEEDYMKELVSKIKDGTVTVKSKMALGTNKVQKYEIFLHNLDRFVYYLRDRLFINPTEFRIYLGYLIESNYIDKILFSKELFEDDSFKFEVYFWQIASERLLGVLGVMSMLDPIRERLEKLKFNPKDYNLKKKDDAREVFNFFSGMICCRHDNLFNLFIDNKTNKKNIILFLIIGVIAFIGKSIKITSLIVLIALITNYFFKYKFKKTVIAIVLIAIPFLAINTIYNKIVVPADRFSFKVNDYGSYPYTHWLMMGVEDPDADNSGRNSYGGYNFNDYEKTLSFKTGKQAQKYNLKEYKRRVSKLGFIGYMEFLTKKNVNIWSDGYYFSNVAIGLNPVKDTKLRRFIQDKKTKFYGIYFNQAVVFSFFITLIVGAYIKLKEKKYKDLDYVRLSIIGILIFLTFWEARSRYLVNFIPIFILIIIEFYSMIYEKNIVKRKEKL